MNHYPIGVPKFILLLFLQATTILTSNGSTNVAINDHGSSLTTLEITGAKPIQMMEHGDRYYEMNKIGGNHSHYSSYSNAKVL